MGCGRRSTTFVLTTSKTSHWSSRRMWPSALALIHTNISMKSRGLGPPWAPAGGGFRGVQHRRGRPGERERGGEKSQRGHGCGTPQSFRVLTQKAGPPPYIPLRLHTPDPATAEGTAPPARPPVT